MGVNNTQAILLAAGRSTRFKRKKSKLLSKICGRAMIIFPLKVLNKLNISTTVVVGYQAEEVKKEIEKEKIRDVSFVAQSDTNGTGSAVLSSKDNWSSKNILVLNADVPLITTNLIKDLIRKHESVNSSVSLLSTYALDPRGYGRIVENDGRVRIYEEKDCPDEFRNSNKINVGVYLFKRTFLQKYLEKLEKSPVSGEFYLTDLIKFASDKNLKVQEIVAPFDEVRGVNDLQELWAVEQVLRSNLIKHWMDNGVRFELAQNIHVDIDVEIGSGSFIGTGAHIIGGSKLGEECIVSAFSIVKNSKLGDGVFVDYHSVIQDSIIGKGAEIGPFARLRSGVSIGDNSVVGNFVEIKNSKFDNNTKAKHLSYIGDATIGKNVNVGAGTVVCNYDGYNKHKTVIEDEVFIGSNDTLVAPIKICKGAYTAAGSTITKDVPAEGLAIARPIQENKDGYARRIKNRLTKKEEEVSIKNTKKFNFIGAVKTDNTP